MTGPANPQLTVIAICFHNPEELAATLESLAGVPGERIEQLVIDCSSDDSCAVVAGRFEGVRLMRFVDRGKYDAMNRGVTCARGEMLLFLNSGDLLASPDALIAVLDEARGLPPGTLVYGDVIARVMGEDVYRNAPHAPGHDFARDELPSHQAVLIPREFHLEHLYDDRMEFAADGKVLRAALTGLRTKYIPKPIAIFVYGGISNSAQSWSKLWRQYRELREAGDLSSGRQIGVLGLLVRRKLFHMVFGEKRFRRIQLARAKRQARRP